MKRFFLVALLLALAPGPSRAVTPSATDLSDVQSALGGDFSLFTNWFAQQFSACAGSLADSGYAGPPAALKTWHFEIGLQGGASMSPLDISAFKNLDTQALPTAQYASSLPSYLPVPLTRLRAHLGLPSLLFFKSTDLGISLGGFNASASGLTAKVSAGGLDFRGNVLEESLEMPVTLCLGLVLDRVTGSITAENDLGSATQDVGGFRRTFTDLTLKNTVDFRNLGVGLRGVVSKSFLGLVPYAGLGAQINSGGTDASMGVSSKLHVQNLSNASDASDGTFGVTSTGSAPVRALDGKILAGLEMHILALYLGLGGEYGLISTDYGANFSVGLSF